jgi:cyclohexanecarboxylate-CoA ligase
MRWRLRAVMTEQAMPCEVVDGSRVIVREQLSEDVELITSTLADHGIGPGDRVVVALPNCYEFVAIDRALERIGAVMVNLPSDYKREIGQVVRMVEARLTVLSNVVEPHVFGDIAPFVSLSPGGGVGELAVVGEPTEAISVPSGAVTWLACTSGSTGTARAATHTLASLGAAVRAITDRYQIGSDDTLLVAASVGSPIGFREGVRLACESGARIVLQRSWDPVEACELIQDYHCSFTAVPASFLHDLVDLGRDLRGTLRHLLAEGGPPLHEQLDAADRLLGEGVASAYYAPAECGPVLCCPIGSSREERANSHGLPMPGMESEIVDDDEKQLPAEAEGELAVRGPQVARGYWMRNDTDHQFRSDGWFMSRERAVRQPTGYVTLLGRRMKEIIVRDSSAISPRELEEALSAHPKVGRAVVVGRRGSRRGEAVVVVATAADEPPSLSDLHDWMAECRVARSKWPDDVQIVEELPRDSAGKIDRSKLHDVVNGSG